MVGPEFHPNYVISEWEEPSSTSKKIWVAIWPSSVVKLEEYKLQVSTCVMVLHLNLALPVVVTDTIFLHKYWLWKAECRGGIKAHHPKISGFEKFLKKHWGRNTAPVVAVARLSLPARV